MAASGVSRTGPVDGAIAFAGVILVLIGVLSVIQGIAALTDSAALVDAPDLVVFGSSTWGTSLIVLGIAGNVIAMGLWMGASVRWVGCFIAAVNALVQMLFMSAYPLWSAIVFGLDVLAIYSLAVLAARPPGERS
jgi:hypothetical protein